MTPKRLEPVTVRILDGLVVLACACGFTLRQALREAISEKCLRCGRVWR